MIITDDTRRTILVGVFISLVVCLFLLILLFSMATEEKQTKQTRAECQQEIQDYINSVKRTSLGWDSSEDMLSAKLHGTAFLNQKIKECNNAD